MEFLDAEFLEGLDEKVDSILDSIEELQDIVISYRDSCPSGSKEKIWLRSLSKYLDSAHKEVEKIPNW